MSTILLSVGQTISLFSMYLVPTNSKSRDGISAHFFKLGIKPRYSSRCSSLKTEIVPSQKEAHLSIQSSKYWLIRNPRNKAILLKALAISVNSKGADPNPKGSAWNSNTFPSNSKRKNYLNCLLMLRWKYASWRSTLVTHSFLDREALTDSAVSILNFGNSV